MRAWTRPTRVAPGGSCCCPTTPTRPPARCARACASLAPLQDWRGGRDAEGRELRATWIAVADEAAAAADLARAKDSREPAVRLRGLDAHVTAADGAGAAALRRPPAEDLFR